MDLERSIGSTTFYFFLQLFTLFFNFLDFTKQQQQQRLSIFSSRASPSSSIYRQIAIGSPYLFTLFRSNPIDMIFEISNWNNFISHQFESQVLDDGFVFVIFSFFYILIRTFISRRNRQVHTAVRLDN